MMKKNMVIAFLIASALAIPATAAPTIKMLNDSTGAYTAKILQDGFAGYAAGSIVSTFGMEAHENFRQGKSYYAVLNTEVVKGGQDWYNGIYGQSPRHNLHADPIDARTAYLFTQFTEGDSRFTNPDMLQMAIYYIEAEITTRNSYVTLAEQAVASGGEWYGKGIGNVRVLNLWERFDGQKFHGHSRDQLIMINPVPAPGAVILCSIGILLVGYLRRRNSI